MRNTDAGTIITIDGVPCPKPVPTDYSNTIEYLRAVWAWRDKVTDAANRAFTEQFRKSLKCNK